jgi:hypothetical protein
MDAVVKTTITMATIWSRFYAVCAARAKGVYFMANIGRLTVRNVLVSLLSAGTLLAVTAALLMVGRPSAAQAAPTSTPSGNTTISALPSGALVLLQRNQPIAILPNGQPVSLKVEQYGPQAPGNGQMGVRFDVVGTAISLTLVDNRNGQTTPIANASGLINPDVTWKKDGSGLVFTDFGVPGKPTVTNGAIMYYDVAGNKTSILIPAPAGQTVTALGWSPDGRYLLYDIGAITTDGSGALAVKPQLWDSTTSKSSALPAAAANFAFWDRAGAGFFIQQSDISKGTSQVAYYPLSALDKPVMLTPPNVIDFLADVSPDGKSVVVSSQSGAKGTAPVANLYVMSLSGANRKAITTFKTPDQAITALIWGTNGIYYSLSGGANGDSTWRVDLDGQNAHQVAVGTLIGIVGVR